MDDTRFDDALRAARVAESFSRQPLSVEEQAIVAAVKLHAYNTLSLLVDRALEALDLFTGDPDVEDDDPAEAVGDEADAAWIEWHRMRGSQKRGPNIAGEHEDDEDSDPAEDDDPDSEHDGREVDDGV